MIFICEKCCDANGFVTRVGDVSRVRCGNPDCGAAGGSSPDLEEAKRLWNRRDALDRIYELAELRMDREGCETLKDIISEVMLDYVATDDEGADLHVFEGPAWNQVRKTYQEVHGEEDEG